MTISSSSTYYLNDLPIEILTIIFLKLNDKTFHDLFNLSRTCRLWRSIIVDNLFLEKRFVTFRRKYLLGHWTFEDATKLGHNSSGYSKDHFSLIGKPYQSTCFLGSCLHLDGHSVITIPVNKFPRYHTDYFTVSCWFLVERWNRPNNESSFQTVIGAWQHPNKHWLHLGFSEAKRHLQNQVMISADHVQFDCNSKTVIELNTWYHVVTRVSRAKQEIYVNGHLENEIDLTLKENQTMTWTQGQVLPNIPWSQLKIHQPQTLCIGAKCLHPSVENFWYGQVADVCIWTHWLEPIVIKTLYQSRTKLNECIIGRLIVNGMKNSS